MTITIDTSQVGRFAADLTRGSQRVQRAAFDALDRSSKRILQDAQRRSSGIKHARRFPQSITSELVAGGLRNVTFEVGPERNRGQGFLGYIFEYGGARSAPMPYLNPSLDAEAPRLEALLTRLATQVP